MAIEWELKPEVLTHPNVPKPLHGINPRTIFGNRWWNLKRKIVYASTDYHCCACGVHKSNAKKHQWLEAHEYFDIDYMTGVCEVKDIVPLCHYCHNFIHSGRLSMIMGKDKTVEEVIDILEHGFKILSVHNLKCFYFTYNLATSLNANTYCVECYEINKNIHLDWLDYVLIFEGKKYRSKFDSKEEWIEFYKYNN